MNQVTSNTKGSMMLEFLISLLLFSVCIGGLAILQNKSIKTLTNQRDAMANGFILEDVIARVTANRLKIHEYIGLSGGDAISAVDVNEIKKNAATFNRKVEITAVGGNDKHQLRIAISEVDSFDAENGDELVYIMHFQDEKYATRLSERN